jgi:hypothetical protein
VPQAVGHVRREGRRDAEAEQPPSQRGNPGAPPRRVEHRHRTGVDQPVDGQRDQAGRPARLTVRPYESTRVLLGHDRRDSGDTDHRSGGRPSESTTSSPPTSHGSAWGWSTWPSATAPASPGPWTPSRRSSASPSASACSSSPGTTQHRTTSTRTAGPTRRSSPSATSSSPTRCRFPRATLCVAEARRWCSGRQAVREREHGPRPHHRGRCRLPVSQPVRVAGCSAGCHGRGRPSCRLRP